ncbi:MAG: hypothetical protein HQL54_03295 [Magnetococcales bacterium]|nr:hypothetical protein [Magnetococcales bacterium]
MSDDTKEPSKPTRLRHKSIYMMDYSFYDGINSINRKDGKPKKSDCRYLSFGLSQWSPNEISIKFLRYTGNKWSRLSEELPIHRFIDSAIFLTKVLFSKNEIVKFEKGTFMHQGEDVFLEKEQRNRRELEHYEEFTDDYTGEYSRAKERLGKLADILIELRNKGEI